MSHQLLWADRSVIKLSTVINRLSNQSRDNETSRRAGDVLSFRVYDGSTFRHWNIRELKHARF